MIYMFLLFYSSMCIDDYLSIYNIIITSPLVENFFKKINYMTYVILVFSLDLVFSFELPVKVSTSTVAVFL